MLLPAGSSRKAWEGGELERGRERERERKGERRDRERQRERKERQVCVCVCEKETERKAGQMGECVKKNDTVTHSDESLC